MMWFHQEPRLKQAWYWLFCMKYSHDEAIKWKHFSRYWPFVWGIHQSTVNSPHKGHWCGALMFPLICAWISSWVNSVEACDLRYHRAHYDVIVMHCLHREVGQCFVLVIFFLSFQCHLHYDVVFFLNTWGKVSQWPLLLYFNHPFFFSIYGVHILMASCPIFLCHSVRTYSL